MLEKLLQWDRETFIYLNSLGIEQYDVFWSTVTNIPTWTPLILLFGFLFFKKYPKKQALGSIATVLVLLFFVLTVTDLTKEVIARLRPNNDAEINTLIRILRRPTGYSFFSGHASSSFSITTLVFLLLRKHLRWTAIFFVWPVLFAMSRIYVGVHYPIDIIVGAVVGICSAWLFYRLYQRIILPYLV